VDFALKLNAFQAVYVSKITEGGATEKDGKLLVGDKVISVSVDFFNPPMT
jgi:PDZ domain